MLSPQKFIQVIEHTQLVSIDLVLLDDKLRVLVGKRVNNPARGTWFVPGGRIYKEETLEQAVERLSLEEVGTIVRRRDTSLIGVYDHIYKTNFLGKKDIDGNEISTHYVCIGMQATIDPSRVNTEIFLKQHSELRWMSIEELLYRKDVHQNTKNYFLK